jgi:hypothetical protein
MGPSWSSSTRGMPRTYRSQLRPAKRRGSRTLSNVRVRSTLCFPVDVSQMCLVPPNTSPPPARGTVGDWLLCVCVRGVFAACAASLMLAAPSGQVVGVDGSLHFASVRTHAPRAYHFNVPSVDRTQVPDESTDSTECAASVCCELDIDDADDPTDAATEMDFDTAALVPFRRAFPCPSCSCT